MSDPGDERLKRDAEALQKRSFGINWKVVGFILLVGTGAVVAVGARIAVKLKEKEAEEAAWRTQQVLNDPGFLDEYVPPAPVVPQAPEVTRYDAVEYEIRIGDFETDVDRDRVTLPGDVPIRLLPAESLVFTHDRLSFRHPASTRVDADESDGVLVAVVIGGGDSSLTIRELGDDLTAEDFVETMTANMERTLGVERDPEPVRGRIGDLDVVGTRVVGATGYESLAFAGTLGSEGEEPMERGIGIVLQRPNDAVSLDPLRSVARTIRPEGREPGGVVEIAYLMEHHPIPLDVPTVVEALPGSPEVLVTRRARVLRRFAGWEFEHDHALAPSLTHHDVLDQLTLRNRLVSIVLAEAPMMQPDEVLAALGAGLDGTPRPVTRSIAGEDRQGQRIDTTFGAERVRAELYAFTLRGRTIGISLQYAPGDAAEVDPLFEPIATTLR